MSENTIIAALGIIAAVFGVFFGLLWKHIEACKPLREDIVEMKGDIKRLIADIGTHETGLRGTVHKTANAVLTLDGRVTELEHKADER